MFLRRRNWDSPNFPRELYHDSKSKRGRVLMHSKAIIFLQSSLAKSHIHRR